MAALTYWVLYSTQLSVFTLQESSQSRTQRKILRWLVLHQYRLTSRHTNLRYTSKVPCKMCFITKLTRESWKSTYERPRSIKLNTVLKLIKTRESKCSTYNFAWDYLWSSYLILASFLKTKMTNNVFRKHNYLKPKGSKTKKPCARHNYWPKKPKKRPKPNKLLKRNKIWKKPKRRNKKMKSSQAKNQVTQLVKETAVRVRTMKIWAMVKITITVLATCLRPQRWSGNWFKPSWMRQKSTETWRLSMKSSKGKFALWT